MRRARFLAVWLMVSAVFVAIITSRTSRQKRLAATIVTHSVDSNREFRLVYRLTNETSSALNLSVPHMEGRQEKTGWWQISTRSIWHFETNAALAWDTVLNPS